MAARRDDIKKKDHAVGTVAALGWILGLVIFDPVGGFGLVASCCGRGFSPTEAIATQDVSISIVSI